MSNKESIPLTDRTFQPQELCLLSLDKIQTMKALLSYSDRRNVEIINAFWRPSMCRLILNVYLFKQLKTNI